MQIKTSSTPARAAGAHLTKLVGQDSCDAIVLLSGGSALEVFNFIQVPKNPECRTIFMMVDERVSGEAEINNYLQLRDLFAHHPNFQLVVDTSIHDDETPEHFAERINNTLDGIRATLQDPKIYALLGVADNGHTAGIFPMEKESFANTYPDDAAYVPVHNKGLTIDSRASFTPEWIKTHVNEIVAYIVGEPKRGILTKLKNESNQLHECPGEILKEMDATVYTDLEIV